MRSRSTALLAAATGFGGLYLAATLALGSTPGPHASGHVVATWFRGHRESVLVWVWLLTLAAPLFATFAALVRARLPAPHRDVFFCGAVAFLVETAVQSWIWGAMTWHTEQLSPSLARILLDVASYWGPVLTGATVMMFAPIALLAAQRHKLVPVWLGVLAAVVCAEQLAETITIFGRGGFIAPGGPMNSYLGAGLVAVGLFSLGIAVWTQPSRLRS